MELGQFSDNESLKVCVKSITNSYIIYLDFRGVVYELVLGNGCSTISSSSSTTNLFMSSGDVTTIFT